MIDNIYNKIVSKLVKNNDYFKLPMDGYNKFNYTSIISGINEYFYRYDNVSISTTYFFHYFSYEFDNIIQEYKNKNNITGELNLYKVYELFIENKNTLNDLSWLITNCNV